MLIGFSINHPALGVPPFQGNPHMVCIIMSAPPDGIQQNMANIEETWRNYNIKSGPLKFSSRAILG